MRCPNCGKYLANCVAYVNEFTDYTEKVEGTCKTHGLVEPEDWEGDDFIQEDGNDT